MFRDFSGETSNKRIYKLDYQPLLEQITQNHQRCLGFILFRSAFELISTCVAYKQSNSFNEPAGRTQPHSAVISCFSRYPTNFLVRFLKFYVSFLIHFALVQSYRFPNTTCFKGLTTSVGQAMRCN